MSTETKINKAFISKKTLILLCSLILPLLIILTKPLDMNFNQSIILGTLILVLTWWTSGVVNRTYASIFLLLIFSIFGSTSLKSVFKFPLSSNFYMIGLSFLLSQGIVNSNVANRFANFALKKYVNTPYKLIIMAFMIGILLIFIIPQPFSRVILIASIYQQFLKDKKMPNSSREVLFFSIFVASTSTYMFFLNGDIILNYAALQFGGASVSWMEWVKYMTVPSLFTSLAIGISFALVFKKELKNVDISNNGYIVEDTAMSSKEKKTIVIMAIVIILWMTEPIHSINAAIITLLGAFAMLIFRIIEFKDFRSINVGLMVFLTAAFAIGSVMNQSGVANIIYSSIVDIFPATYSNLYLFILILTVMALHMLLGSSITTLSVVVPGLIELTQGAIDIIPLTLLIYIAINMHYILPFHHVTIMIGAGNNYYSNNIIIRFGIILTIIIFVVIFGFYIPWWKFINLI